MIEYKFSCCRSTHLLNYRVAGNTVLSHFYVASTKPAGCTVQHVVWILNQESQQNYVTIECCAEGLGIQMNVVAGLGAERGCLVVLMSY